MPLGEFVQVLTGVVEAGDLGGGGEVGWGDQIH